MQKIIFLDTETGGLDRDTDALLTIGYSVTNQLYNIFITREFKLPINGEIHQSALDVNGLDVSNWQADSTIKEVVDNIEQDIGESEDVALYGHNIFFDLNFIRSKDKEQYNRIMSMFKRNIVDTKSLFVQLVQDYKYDGSCSMHKIMGNEEKHTAGGDTKLNAELMKKYSIINSKK